MKKKMAAIITGITVGCRGLSRFKEFSGKIRRIGTVPLLMVVTFFEFVSMPAYAQMDHSMHGQGAVPGEMMNEGQMGMQMPSGMVMHEMDIDDHKVKFHIMDRQSFRNYMDNMGHKTHMMKEGMTHYVMMEIFDKDGNRVKRAKVKLKVIDPNEKAEEKAAFPMMGNFGAEFDMSHMGRYQVMTLFKVKEKKHKGGFWHEKK